MSSWESIDGTNSLLIKRPVGTLIFFPRLGTAIEATRDMMMDEDNPEALS